MSNSLRQASRYKANQMLQYDYFSHESPYTGNPWDLAKGYGHSYLTFGENIWTMSSTNAPTLRGNISAAKIVSDWMNSQGHRENILGKGYGRIGLGVVLGSNGKCYVSQMFTD